MQRIVPFLLVLLMATVPCQAGVRMEKKPKMSMAERKEQARQAAEARREQAKVKAEERRLKNRSKAEKEADAAAEAEQRHAAELEESAAEAKRQRAEREKAETQSAQAHSAAVRKRLANRAVAIKHFNVKPGEEWSVHTGGLKAFSSLDIARKYVKLAAEDPEEARELAEEEEDETLIFVNKGGHLVVKATNADSLMPAPHELKDGEENTALAQQFDTRTGALTYLTQAAEVRGLIRVVTRRKEEYYVLYRDLLSMATPPEREETPLEDEAAPQEEELQEEYEYGDDLW